jgi:hypothetical protein
MLKTMVVEYQEDTEKTPASLLPEKVDQKADLRKIVNGFRAK